MSGVLVVAPTRREMAGYRGPSAVVGIGPASGAASREAIAGHRPSVVLSVGMSGALDPDLQSGDLVISLNATLAETGDRLSIVSEQAEAAFAALASAGLHVAFGDAVTVSTPAASATAKAKQRDDTGASVVDMETYWMGKAASDASVPLVSVRAVVDEAAHPIPRFAVAIIEDGGRNEVRHALGALVNPVNVGPMIALALRARRATNATRSALQILNPAFALHLETVP